MFEYTVLSEHDKRFSGRFDVDALEATLNSYASYAAEGWRLAESVAAATS